jgi:hypothetical protein
MITLTEVPAIPVNPPATIWNDILNLQNMVSNPVVDAFRPQYTIYGNRIDFRGLLYIPLEDGGVPIDVTQANSYLYVPSAITDNTRLSVISNANFNNGTPQGRFFTPDVVNLKNLPPQATPLQRDIVFSDVFAYRRYATGLSSQLMLYRTILDVRIFSNATVFNNSGNSGAGCIGIFSPYGLEYDGSGSVPNGDDPFGLLISRTNVGLPVNNYVGATDNFPFTIGSGVVNSPFSLDAHNITSLGGFIINLSGKYGFLN